VASTPNPEEGLREATGRGAMWSGLGYVAQYAVQFVFTVITARLLPPHDFGIMGLAVIVISVGTLFADTGTQAAIVHRAERLDEAINTAFISVPLSGLLAMGLGMGAAPLLAWFYGEEQVLPVTIALAGVLFVRSLGLVTDAILQRRMLFKWRRAIVDPVAVLASGVTSCVLAVLGAGVWSLVAGWYALTITTVLGSWILARYRPHLGMASFRTWRELAHYGRSLFGAGIVQLAYGYTDTLAIGRNLSPADVGYYGAATRLALLPVAGIANVAGGALFPAFARMRDDLARVKGAYLEALRYIAILTIPICVAIAAVSTPLVVVLFGDRWRPAGEVLAVLMLWAIPYSLFEVSGEFLKGLGRPGLIFHLTIIKFVSFAIFIAVVWSLHDIGLQIVAIGLATGMFIAIGVEAWMLNQVAEVTPRLLWRALRPSVLGGAAMAAVIIPVVKLGMPGLDGWHPGQTGPLVPLVMMGLVCVVGAAIYLRMIERTEAGTMRHLRRQARRMAGRGARA
jgi:O-antigen/teichoic acid export membrane protein